MTCKLERTSTCASSKGMGPLGILALVAAFAFGAVFFGPALAVDCVLVGIVEESIFTGAVFAVLSKYFTADAAREASETSTTNATSVANATGTTNAIGTTNATSAATVSRTKNTPTKTRLANASVAKSAATTALLFALCHLAQPWKLPIAFVFSLCMIWLYRRSGSIMWPVCAHTVFDMLWFGLFALP
ncbi:CPBP family intramembrane glutamic endopeptidase [Adlercreutzia sp. ZJ154]|uniref:CPBP family intramembrane glutamic endopeptidase n=1 Tax=Adlercreutzia sp. ZJ154 TaxID=2709790 RepID=UPI0013EC4A8F|nr:CPBP family glutamic-type intramembrane protease [Adlercreutzia sp. ZJ154]